MNKYLKAYLEWFEDKVIPNQPIPHPAPSSAIYGVVIGDRDGLSRPSYKEVYELGVPRGSKFPLNYGLPATVKTFNSKFMKLTRPWQLYWFGLLRLAFPEMTLTEQKRAWAGLTRGNVCYTNGKGSDSLADYINGTNLSEGPMMKETIFTTGAILLLLDGAKIYTLRGGRYYKIAILDGNKKPPALPTNTLPTPWTHWASNSRRELHWEGDVLEGREDIVNRFPQGHTPTRDYDVPVPNMGNGTFDYISIDRIRILDLGEPFPYPYNF